MHTKACLCTHRNRAAHQPLLLRASSFRVIINYDVVLMATAIKFLTPWFPVEELKWRLVEHLRVRLTTLRCFTLQRQAMTDSVQRDIRLPQKREGRTESTDTGSRAITRLKEKTQDGSRLGTFSRASPWTAITGHLQKCRSKTLLFSRLPHSRVAWGVQWRMG